MTNSTLPRRGSWYQRLVASIMAGSGEEYEGMVRRRKQALLGSLHGNVLEIGPGAGPNLPFYSSDVHWLGIEPNPAMYPYIQRKAAQLRLNVELREGQAEQLDAPDNSVDAVVSTLVLCTVHDQQKTLQEILRVLKPGGRYIFIEHVAAPEGTGLRSRQELIKPLWKIIGDGCHPDRETWATIERAGFDHVELEHFRLALPIMGPHIAGIAVK